MAEDVPPAVVAEIKDNADRYPGVKIVELARRTYPQGTLAAHVLGHLGLREEKDAVGQTFLSAELAAVALRPRAAVNCRPTEPSPKPTLSAGWASSGSTKPCCEAHPGVAVEQTDRGGHVVTSYRRLEPVAGQDVELTLDVALQRTAEELLRSAWNADRRPKKGSELFVAGK